MTTTGHRFEEDEYLGRESRVRALMHAREIDLLYLTSPANIAYLTGYEASWYPPKLPLGCAIAADEAGLTFFDWTRHEAYARRHARCAELVLFDYGDAAEVASHAIRDRHPRCRTVAVEWSSPTPAAPVTTALANALSRGGARIVSGDSLVDRVRLVKSAAEVTSMRRAARIVDAAFTALVTELRAGLTAAQVSALVSRLLADAGGEQAAQAPLVSAGPTAWMDTHAFPGDRPLEHGDIVTIDACGVVNRYHANLSRSFSLGEPDARAVALIEAAAGSVDELCGAARIGEGLQLAAAAGERWVRERVAPERIWWIGGYSLGIAFPPSWVGHAYLASSDEDPIEWEAGYVSNYEVVMHDRTAGFEASTIDTVLMTDNGLEVLSALPRVVTEIPV